MRKRGLLLTVFACALLSLGTFHVNVLAETGEEQTTTAIKSRTARAKDRDRDEKIKDIDKIQLDVSKIPVSRYGKDKLYELVNNIEILTSDPANLAENVTKPKDYNTLCFHYKDGTKKLYCVFSLDEKTYMEDPDGAIWANADFIEMNDVTAYHPLYGPSTYTMKPNERLGEILALAKEMDVLDERYHFTVNVWERMGYGLTEEEAISGTREKPLSDMRIYQYAVKHGMEISEEKLKELKELKELQDKTMEDYFTDASNSEEMNQYYTDAGITREELNQKDKDFYKIKLTIEQMWNAKYEEFRHGNDKIGAYECENAEEYWSRFILEEVLSEAQAYDLSEYEKKLDEAEVFCHNQNM